MKKKKIVVARMKDGSCRIVKEIRTIDGVEYVITKLGVIECKYRSDEVELLDASIDDDGKVKLPCGEYTFVVPPINCPAEKW